MSKPKTKTHWTTALRLENELLNSSLSEANKELQFFKLESQTLIQKLNNALGKSTPDVITVNDDGKLNLSELFTTINILTDELLLKLGNNSSPEVPRENDMDSLSEFNPTLISTPSRARHLINEDDETIGIEDTYSIVAPSPNLTFGTPKELNDSSIIPMSQVMVNLMEYTSTDEEN
ncbi:hypothetical protein DAPPUDRAFT_333597 [Daphnia pulex]|uniref:Uncharacterized protein n=1 Tax=Daphnia pulex TaxID=6669 RepID=E9HTA4_DAPPU|nr:hypothetical protein DAPPUDRAFT_333597 [Daphnia pulex]|eukprot:EFX65031.1 hypothetical protein DAPPUDRAFT_333597 [Daphnia pulex]